MSAAGGSSPLPPGEGQGEGERREHFDVLVIGGGLAGAIAALSASERGARVALVRRSPGATALSSGAVSVAPDPTAAPGDPFAARRPPLESARRLAALRPEHPYARVGPNLDRLGEALDFAARALAPLLTPFDDRTRWLMTPFGVAVPCALCQVSQVDGDLSRVAGTIAVVGLRGRLGFDAGRVAEGVNRLSPLGAPRAVPVVADLFMREADAVARPHELARSLEPPGGAERAGTILREVLPTGAALALFPPLLGLGPGTRVRERLAEAAGIAVAETLSDVPSISGLRLQAAIDQRLAAAGVHVIFGLPSASGPGSPLHLGPRTLEAPAWVLATGRFISGGILRRGRLEEPLLGLPVEAAEAGASGIHLAARPAASLTARDFRAPQPLLSAGLRVDHRLRPLGTGGAPVHERLHAAGSVIGGHDAASDGTGLGVAILTGWLAGRAAAGAL